jgi:alpha-D-ribose 1-methylphosphonate 5-triphosphate synthase subunit PhnH
MMVLTGLAEPVLDSQRIFRAVLDAMPHPGRVVSVPVPIEAPAPLEPATAALCLALVDLETLLWLDTAAGQPEVIDYVRFHCGCPITAEPGRARFAVVADAPQMPDLGVFDAGSDEYPDRSATVIVQVGALTAGVGVRLTGPGIETEAWLDM